MLDYKEVFREFGHNPLIFALDEKLKEHCVVLGEKEKDPNFF